VEHRAALRYAELAEFIMELRRQEGIETKALEFAILTVARAGKVIGARWVAIRFRASPLGLFGPSA
jgi:hypothetical protein